MRSLPAALLLLLPTVAAAQLDDEDDEGPPPARSLDRAAQAPQQQPQDPYRQDPAPVRISPGQYQPRPFQPERDAYGRLAPYRQAPAQAQQARLEAPPPARLVLTTASEAARADALACADLLEGYHLEAARAKCAEALAKDPDLAVAHLWMAQAAATPSVVATEVARASELVLRASSCERALVDGWRTWREGRLADSRHVYDQLVVMCAGERRGFLARAQLRQAALGNLEGAVEDARRAVALDEKAGPSYNALGFALADLGKLDEAQAALRKYVALAPSEPNAHDSLAVLALRAGDASLAIAEEHKALTIDPRFVVAHATLGDALLASGKPKEARREYALVEAADDPALRFDGALRAARTLVWEDRTLDGERALIRAGDAARKAGRPDLAVEAFLETARIQVERGALAEAGRGLREAAESLAQANESGGAILDEPEQRRLAALMMEVRAMTLASVNERDLAEGRADELAALLHQWGDPHADERVRGLRGFIAARVGDDKTALAALEGTNFPSLRLAWALALGRSGDNARARSIMEELARRAPNDLETALSRPRAAAWLKIPASTSAAK